MKYLIPLILALFAISAEAQTLKFTGAQTVNTNGSVTTTLTWCTEKTATAGTSCGTSGPASGCTASGGWTGTKAASGTQTMPAVTTSQTYALQCSWPGSDTMTLTWTAPTKNDDQSTLTDLKGFRIYMGPTTALSSTAVRDLADPAATTTLFSGLAPGTYYAAVTAYNSIGVESVKSSPIVSKTITAAASVSQTVKVTFPEAPTNLVVQ